ncbi:MAG: DNA-3-methyladenine glycosylase 2 family protein [Lachnospiraceae bacterium]|nr:DNA-3-methyladenine glycosylase 2 family protein [Lachnospiraceae bacterium]
MRIYSENKNTIIEGVVDFDLEQTLECGQCFRFYKQADHDYVVVAYKHLLHIAQDDKRLIFYDKSKDELKKIWLNYFDLERDYNEIKTFLLSKDDVLKPAIEEKWGIRLLNQEFHEMVISYIISQNKQIPHIKKIVRDISEKYGDYLGSINGEDYYSFPDIDKLYQITEEDFRELKTGFRAPYLVDACSKLYNNEISVSTFENLSGEEAVKKLTQIKGVGNKVANCVMLFSLNYRASFPIDVWIKRIMEELYFKCETDKETIEKFALEKYGDYGGYAQQYLFCFGRDNKVGK